MIDYTGLNCPVCGKPFARNDDIVVCPECGAPYHRECYAKEGKCVFSDKHGTNAAWAPPKQEAQKEPVNRAECKTKRCPRCGNMNSQSAMFCDRCGQSLTINQQDIPGFQQNQTNPQNGFPPYGAPFQQGQPVPFLFDPMGGVNPNDQIDDVPAGDISKLVQNNTPYYLPVFMNLKRFGKNRFNFSAFLFSGGWMLYRKQYKIGSIITAVMTALYLISTYVSIHFATPLLQTMFQKQGISLDSGNITYAQMMQVLALVSQQPDLQVFLFCLPTIIGAIQIVIMLIVGFNGNKWYLKHCVSKVKQIRQDSSDATRTAIQYQEQGGVNAALAICLLICYMIVMYLPQIL